MKSHFRHIIPAFILLFAGLVVNAQVSIKASVDRDKILIGEPITLTLQAYAPLGESVTWIPLDTIPRFEFIRIGKLDTIENVDNKKLEQTLIITSFDSGGVVLAPLEMKVGDKSYFTDSILIDVAYKDFDPAADYKDIKSIEEVEDNSIDYIPWIIGAVTLISIALIVWLLRRKKKTGEKPSEVKPALPPYEEAMQALDKLRNHDWTQPIAAKLYYTELNDIFRVYVNRKLSLTSLEKTNDELIMQLRQSGISKEGFAQLAETLRMSDFVKFARYQPLVAVNENNREVIRSSIKKLEEIVELNRPRTND